MYLRSRWVILQLLSLLSFVTIFPAIFSAVPLFLLKLQTSRLVFLLYCLSAELLLCGYFLVANPKGVIIGLIYLLVIFWGALAGELALLFVGLNSLSVKNKFWFWYWLWGTAPLILGLLVLVVSIDSPLEMMAQLQTWVKTQVLDVPSTHEMITELKKTSSTDPATLTAISLLEDPVLFTRQLVFMVPSYCIVGYYSMAFMTVFFATRFEHVTKDFLVPDWGKQIVNSYQNADWLIVPVILLLSWQLFHPQLPLSPFWKVHGELLGSSLINVLGVFFFFQGFVVLLHLMQKLAISGFFRVILLFAILTFALWGVVILGLADMWFSFRKMEIKKAIK